MADDDMKIDMTQLDLESIKIPSLHHKYLRMLQQESITYKKLMNDMTIIKKDRWMYYMGKAEEAVYQAEPFDLKITRSEVDVFIDADPKITTLKAKIDYQQEKVKYLEEIVRGFNNRNWNIRNAIEWKKFISGVT